MHVIIKDQEFVPTFDVAEKMIANHLERWLDDRETTPTSIITGLARLPRYLRVQVTDEFVRWASCNTVRWDGDRCIGLVNDKQAVS